MKGKGFFSRIELVLRPDYFCGFATLLLPLFLGVIEADGVGGHFLALFHHSLLITTCVGRQVDALAGGALNPHETRRRWR
jgi:hypothetical protein